MQIYFENYGSVCAVHFTVDIIVHLSKLFENLWIIFVPRTRIQKEAMQSAQKKLLLLLLFTNCDSEIIKQINVMATDIDWGLDFEAKTVHIIIRCSSPLTPQEFFPANCPIFNIWHALH